LSCALLTKIGAISGNEIGLGNLDLAELRVNLSETSQKSIKNKRAK